MVSFAIFPRTEKFSSPCLHILQYPCPWKTRTHSPVIAIQIVLFLLTHNNYKYVFKYIWFNVCLLFHMMRILLTAIYLIQPLWYNRCSFSERMNEWINKNSLKTPQSLALCSASLFSCDAMLHDSQPQETEYLIGRQR